MKKTKLLTIQLEYVKNISLQCIFGFTKKYEFFVEMDMKNFETLKHCHRGLELYEACYKLMARYIQESGHERQGYFDRIDALVSESDHVTKEINFRLNQLKQQKREAKQNPKRKVEMVH